jgi:hypothetical protein
MILEKMFKKAVADYKKADNTMNAMEYQWKNTMSET